jgi:HEAT repeat protein
MPLLPLTEWPALVFRLLLIGTGLATGTAIAVAIERIEFARVRLRRRVVEARYLRVIRRALSGDAAAVDELAGSPARYRLELAAILIEPLIEDRDPVRIARTRAVIEAMAVVRVADAYLRSWWWWRRAVAIRVLGLIQMTDHTPQIIAALDDVNPDVRAAALDALRDLHSRDALNAIVVRFNDPTLHAGRRAAALMAYGGEAEPLILELGRLHEAERARYARALAWCGSARARGTLLEWTHDSRTEVQAAALEALARVGLDDRSAHRAAECLEHRDARVRATAAQALRGWQGSADTAAQLARHLDDVWTVAVRSAHALRSIRPDGVDALRRRAAQDGIAGTLARQMLWEERIPA